MPSVVGLVRTKRRTRPHAGERRNEPPESGRAYLQWLEKTWRGDLRELREGRYLHHQADLRDAFEASEYWSEVGNRLYKWSKQYHRSTAAFLFRGRPALPEILTKPWESFLNRTWRENNKVWRDNIEHHRPWDDPPEEGWWLPDNWFERAWDIVRTRFVVQYLDAAKVLESELVELAKSRRFNLDAHAFREQKDSGYYAIHVYIPQAFSVDTLDYAGTQQRTSIVEIQIMTSVAELISQLTHLAYETGRGVTERPKATVWNPNDEHSASKLFRKASDLEDELTSFRENIAKKRRRTPG